MTHQRPSTEDRSVLRAAWQYKWLVLALVIAFAAAALLVSSRLPGSYVARASILLEDPRAQAVLSEAPTASARNVQNQLEVFRSSIVAQRAVEIAGEQGIHIGLGQLLNRVDIVNVTNTDLISVSFSGESEQEALAVTTAMLDAYLEVGSNQRDEETDRILARLESAKEILEEELANVQIAISEIVTEHGFDTQIDRLLAELTALESQLATGNPSAEQRQTLMGRQGEIDNRLRTLELARQIDISSDAVEELNHRRNEILNRIEGLDLERSAIEIQAQTAGSGIAFVDSAQITSVSDGAGGVFTLAVGAFLGLLVGLGWAYSLSSRRTTFDDRRQPETILDVPLLGDIPKLGRGAASSQLPVRDQPLSLVSEAFRFTSNSIEVALARREGNGVVFLSNVAGQGKTLLVANTALAAAREGKSVLVVDADFGNQELTRVLLGEATGLGITEVVSQQALLRDVVRQVELPGAGTVDVLQRGHGTDTAPEFFERDLVKQMFRDLIHRYDLVLVDVPPLMQVAYTSTIAALVENAVFVIRKGAKMDSTEDMLRRARFIGVEVLGYIYNSGVSDDPRHMMGSMRNVLGDRAESTAASHTGTESAD